MNYKFLEKSEFSQLNNELEDYYEIFIYSSKKNIFDYMNIKKFLNFIYYLFI